MSIKDESNLMRFGVISNTMLNRKKQDICVPGLYFKHTGRFKKMPI